MSQRHRKTTKSMKEKHVSVRKTQKLCCATHERIRNKRKNHFRMETELQKKIITNKLNRLIMP